MHEPNDQSQDGDMLTAITGPFFRCNGLKVYLFIVLVVSFILCIDWSTYLQLYLRQCLDLTIHMFICIYLLVNTLTSPLLRMHAASHGHICLVVAN